MHSTEPQLSGKGDTLGSLQFNSNKASGNSKNVNASSKAGRTDFLFTLFLRAGVLSSLQEVLGMGGFFGYITFFSFDQISSGTRVTFLWRSIFVSELLLPSRVGLLRRGHSPDQTCQTD